MPYLILTFSPVSRKTFSSKPHQVTVSSNVQGLPVVCPYFVLKPSMVVSLQFSALSGHGRTDLGQYRKLWYCLKGNFIFIIWARCNS
jgi:hypothetical protein